MAFDPAAATARYIDSLGAEALQKAAAYTSGNHWTLLWGLLISALLTWIIVRLGLLERVSARLGQRGWAVRTFLVCAVYLLVSTIFALPWSIYTDWIRETAYGRTTQPLGDFLFQGLISTALSTVLMGFFLLGVYVLIRRAGRGWWIWASGLTGLTVSVMMLVAPILLQPIFNSYQPVPEGPVRIELLKLADQAGIAHDRLFMFDGSRQSSNFTANVAGVMGTARIAISDVAMKQASLDEVKAVTGHEIGHYVLGHVWRIVAMSSLLALAGFFLVNLTFARVARLFGSNAAISDPTGLPVLLFLFSLFMFFATPITNAVTRMGEREADNYSLRTVGLPDALASALVKTAEYRYPRPTALQEALFYTHPSVEWRVRNAMDWKAAHLASGAKP